MSGFYQNWIKVQNPNLPNDIIPMQSGGFQTPFFFGGSQVPINLNLTDTNLNISGTGLKSYYKTKFLPDVKGKGVAPVQFQRQSRIVMPRQLGSLSRQM
jgi:hypothetical protein